MLTSTDNEVRAGQKYLSVETLTVGYGSAPIIKDLSLAVHRGEVVTVIGPNGAGKSTLLKALTGRLKPQSGRVLLDGADVTGQAGNTLTRVGVGYVLPKREVAARVDFVLETFPSLAPLLNRAGKLLSGGERKLLGIGRCLISSPKILILDEPTAALSPMLAHAILEDHVTALAQSGTTILLVEQRAHQAMQISNWCYVLVGGQVEISSAPGPLLAQPDFGELFLGRSARPRT